MKTFTLILLTIIFHVTLRGQTTDTWTLFWNNDTSLTGYKDKFGNIKIEPKFIAFQTADKFDYIIAATEEIEGKWKRYYLNKSGKIFGQDSLYYFDNTSDCESEGFIRFRNKKTEKVGLFNSFGEVVISDEYDELTMVRKGLIVGLKGAEKNYWDKEEQHSGCNHFSWTGGTIFLLDTSGRILTDRFTLDNYKLNFYSIEKSSNPDSDTTRSYFPSKDSSYYSLIDFEKEFKRWLLADLFVDLTPEKLVAASFDTIIWESRNGWAKTDRQKLISNNFELLSNGMKEILSKNCDFMISFDGLNQFMFQGEKFEKYFTNCGEGKYWLYPTMNLVVSHKKSKTDISQNHYQFLRTDNGYKLISLVVRNRRMK